MKSFKERVQEKKDRELLKHFSDTNFRVTEDDRIVNDHGEEFEVAPPTIFQQIMIIGVVIGVIWLYIKAVVKLTSWLCDKLDDIDNVGVKFKDFCIRLYLKVMAYIKSVIYFTCTGYRAIFAALNVHGLPDDEEKEEA